MTVLWYDFLVTCLSTDTKPTAHPNGPSALFGPGWRLYETNTHLWYTWDGNSWNLVL